MVDGNAVALVLWPILPLPRFAPRLGHFRVGGDSPNTRTKAPSPVRLLIRRRLLDVIYHDVLRGNLGRNEFEAKRS